MLDYAIIRGCLYDRSTHPCTDEFFAGMVSELKLRPHGVAFKLDGYPPTYGVTDHTTVEVVEPGDDPKRSRLTVEIKITDAFSRFLASGRARTSDVRMADYRKAAEWLELPVDEEALAAVPELPKFQAEGLDVVIGKPLIVEKPDDGTPPVTMRARDFPG